MHAQFIVVPPLTKIMDLFTKVTGRHFAPGVSWVVWEEYNKEDVERFRKYIRPSHQRILDDVISGTSENPCSLLRQLLRPHNYTIRRNTKGWSLHLTKDKESDEEGGGEGGTATRVSVTVLEKPATIEWV
jgi:hypothetical protein